MSTPYPIDERLSNRRTLIRSIAGYFAILIALGCAIWFELPSVLASGLLAAALTLALFIAVRVGRSVARTHASLPFALRPSLTARSAGVLVFVALAPLAIACSQLIYPRSWPTTIEGALAILDAQVDASSKRQLAYTGFDDLTDLDQGWKRSIRNDFGLWDRNNRLLKRCDPEYKNPESCASTITSRFWRRARAELPADERLALERLESNMERVRVQSEQFERRPLQEVVAHFNEAIDAQLAENSRFTIRYDAAHADKPVSAAWHVMDNISLREALGIVAASNRFKLRKAPPDLFIEAE